MLDEMPVILDASVVLKWFREESDTNKALEFQEAINDNQLQVYIPDLLFYEVTNALIRSVGETHDNVLLALQVLLEMNWEVVIPNYGLLASAALVTQNRNKLSVYDGVYVALALERKATLITADTKLHRAFGEPVTRLL